MYEDEVVIET